MKKSKKNFILGEGILAQISKTPITPSNINREVWDEFLQSLRRPQKPQRLHMYACKEFFECMDDKMFKGFMYSDYIVMGNSEMIEYINERCKKLKLNLERGNLKDNKDGK